MSGLGLSPQQSPQQCVLGDIRSADQGRLVAVCFKGQSVEQLAYGPLVHTLPFGQARLDDLVGAVRPALNLLAFPLIEQQVDGVGVELFALVRERAAAPGMQRSRSASNPVFDRHGCGWLPARAAGEKGL
jgi:hypothetical protein